MAESWDGSYNSGSHSDGRCQEKLRVGPIYEQGYVTMSDPVTIENGQAFEGEAIEKWFKECTESGKRPICPLTMEELKSTELNLSIALWNTIGEWKPRNDSAQLEIACKYLAPGSSESDVLQASNHMTNFCQKSEFNKCVVRNAELIPAIVDMLKNTSQKVHCEALETLRVVAEDDYDNKEVVSVGDTIRTIVKFLSHDHSQAREEAASLLCELSKSKALCEKIGVNEAILILVAMSSSKSENILAVEIAENTLKNREKCENNVRQMAENGRLQPPLTLLLEEQKHNRS